MDGFNFFRSSYHWFLVNDLKTESVLEKDEKVLIKARDLDWKWK